MPHTENGKVFEEFVYERINYDKDEWINLTPYELLDKPRPSGQRYSHTEFTANFKKVFKKDPLSVLSKKINPDLVFYNPKLKKVIVIEDKIQTSDGSVDEKIQTPAAKIYILKKLFKLIDCNNVSYYYMLDNNSYNKQKYKDTYEYLDTIENCKYFFVNDDFFFEIK